jgi:N-methylhydantoinase A
MSLQNVMIDPMSDRTRDYRIAVDVGGTFTDLVLNDNSTGEFYYTKTPSTPSNPEKGTVRGVEKILDETDVDPSHLSTLIHGTTVATNSVIERNGARAGLIVTEGTRDVLEIRRQHRPHLYDFREQKEPTVVPRERIYEVEERVLPDGTVQTPLDTDDVYDAVEALRAQEVESVAVCLLHSYHNDDHEREIAGIIDAELPDVDLSLSSDVLPEFKEYERMSTTTMNAYLMPVMDEYIENFDQGLSDIDIDAPLHIMQSNGGVMSAEEARSRSVQTIVSGPAAGALCGKALTDRDNFITTDMGGTSFDVALCHDNELEFTDESNLSGHVIRVPQINISTVGAGGGSIAWVDDGGALRVGPQSAGAHPGPIAYGKGGTEPTVTDANVVLGRLNQEYLLDGEMAVNLTGAQEAIREQIAEPLGLSVTEAAQGIIDVVNANMISSMRVISVERGYDPREFALISFGGAGPLHSAELADEMDMPESIIPYAPGVNSAIGLLAADYRNDYVETYLQPLQEADFHEIEQLYEGMIAEATNDLESQDLEDSAVSFVPELQMRYRGQGYNLDVPLDLETLSSDTVIDTVRESFSQRHKREYGFARPEEDVQVVNLTLSAIGDTNQSDLEIGDVAGDSVAEPFMHRDVYFEGEWHNTPIFDRTALPVGVQKRGPLVIEQQDSTTVVPPEFALTVDESYNLLIERRHD